jgi:signal peptidase I
MAESNQSISLVSVHLFAELATDLLRQGKSVRFRAPGRSMYPTIKEGEIITVEPIEPAAVRKGDIILCHSDAGVVAHRVVHIIETELPPPCLLDNSHLVLSPQTSSLGPHPSSLSTQCTSLSPHYCFVLRDDTWSASPSQFEDRQVLGKVVAVERNGRKVDPHGGRARIRLIVHTMGSRMKRWMTW